MRLIVGLNWEYKYDFSLMFEAIARDALCLPFLINHIVPLLYYKITNRCWP